MNNQGLKFEIGFWHPFGPHGGETPEQIINRKQNEIDENHWRVAGRRSVKRIFELRRTQEVQLTGRGDAVGVTATLAL